MIRIKQLYPSGETIVGIPDPIRRNVVEIPHGIAAHPQLASKNTYHDESFGSRRSLATAIQRIPCVIEEHGKEGSGPTDPFFYLLEFQWQILPFGETTKGATIQSGLRRVGPNSRTRKKILTKEEALSGRKNAL